MNKTIKHPNELGRSAQKVLKAHLQMIELLTREKALEIVPVFISRLIEITLGKVPYEEDLLRAPDVVLKDNVAKKVHMCEWEAIRNAVVTAWATAILTSDKGEYDEYMHGQAQHFIKAVEAAPNQFKMPALYDVDYENVYFLQLFMLDDDEDDTSAHGSFAFDQDTGAWATFGSKDEAHQCATEALDEGYAWYEIRRPIGNMGFTEVVHDSNKPNFKLD